MAGTVEVETRGKVGIIRLNRPAKLNAINMEMVGEIVDALDSFEKDSAVRALIVTGNGRAFSAGADIAEMSQMSMEQVARGGHMPLWTRMKSFRKPVIAALNGMTAGGGLELAMACDIAIASRSATLGQTETNLGIIPGAGGTQRLTRAVGKQKAMEMVMTGRMMSADEAAGCGLILRAVDDGHLMDEAMSVANAICSRPQLAMELSKECINAAFETALQQGLEFERRDFLLSLGSEEGREGLASFVEKRKPEWK